MEELLLREILTEVKDTKASVNRLESRMDSMEPRMYSMESRMDSMQSTLDEHTALLQALEHRVEENTAQLTALAEDTNCIRQSVTRMEKKIDKQNAIIEMIVIKYSEQEAELGKLKRIVLLEQEA